MRWERGTVCVPIAGFCGRVSVLGSGVQISELADRSASHLLIAPPANFETEEPYIVVELDKECREQQLGEGWFKKVDDVPSQAISMTIKQILKSKNIICSVPDSRKAEAVKNSLEQEICNIYPASILQRHPSCIFYLDKSSASLLSSGLDFTQLKTTT